MARNIDSRQLILIEGIPGSGKTTLAHALNTHFLANGVDSVWYDEEDHAHPVFDRSLLKSEKNSTYLDLCVSAWERFREVLDQPNHPSHTILDAYPFQNSIRFAVEYDLPASEWYRYLDATMACIKDLSPAIIYMHHPAPEAYLAGAFLQRKPLVAAKIAAYSERTPFAKKWHLSGHDALVALYSAYHRACDELVDRADIPTLKLNSDSLSQEEVYATAWQWLCALDE